MTAPPLYTQGAGRFDDPMLRAPGEDSGFGVLYLGATAKASFIETLSGLRYQLRSEAKVLRDTIMEVDERDTFVTESQHTASQITPDWMSDWHLTSAEIRMTAPLFDLGNPEAVQFIRQELALTILAMGYHDLDFSHVLSDNRDLTRAISRWLWTMTNDSGKPLFSGIRYRSRFDPQCICLALYEGRFSLDGEIEIEPVTPTTPGLAEAASTLRLEIA